MVTCWLMHWQTSHLAGSQNTAEMAACLLVIQHNGRVCGCMCVYFLCVGGWLCVLNLLIRAAFCAFCMFFCDLCVLLGWVLCLITVLLTCFWSACRYLYWRQLFFPKSKLSWCNCLWTVQKCAFVYARVVCVYVSVCPQERAIKGAVWWSDCLKGVREETEWQAAEGAACGGGRGGAMQVPNSTSAQGVICSIHLSLLCVCMGLLWHVANPPASITVLISRYIRDSNQNNNTRAHMDGFIKHYTVWVLQKQSSKNFTTVICF